MPAPRPSIIAITAANVGRPSGAETAASRSWPAATPSSAPISVAAIAAPERNSSVSRTIAMSTPTSSPTGASCSDARSMRIAALLDLDRRARRSRPPRSAPRRPPSRSRRVGRVAHVDRREPPVLGDLAARLERARRELDAVELADLRQRALDRRPRRRRRRPCRSSTVKTSVESAPPNAGECAWKRSIACLGLGAGDRVVVAWPRRPAPAARTSSTSTPSAAARLRFQCEESVRAMRARAPGRGVAALALHETTFRARGRAGGRALRRYEDGP